MTTVLLNFCSVLALAGYAAFVLLRRRRGMADLLHALLFLLLGGTQLFDSLTLLSDDHFFRWRYLALCLEALLPLLLAITGQLFFATDKLSRPRPGQMALLVGAPCFLVAVALFPAAAFYYNPDAVTEHVLFLGAVGSWFYLALMLYEVAALVQLERCLRGLSREELWQGKFQLIGAGAILAVFLVYHSQALLYRTLDLRLLPIRSLVVLLGVGLLFYARIWRGEVRKIVLSYDMALRSVVLLLVGLYMLALALFGQGMRLFGMIPQKPLMIGAGFLLALLLLVVLLSTKVQRRLQVLLHKHFYTKKYDYRQKWLDFSNRLAEVENERSLQQRLLEFCCDTFGLRGGALLLRDADRGVFCCTCRFGTVDAPETIADASPLAQFLAERDWIFDAGSDEPSIVAAHPELIGGGTVRFVVPVRFGRRLEGMLALGPPVDDAEQFSYEDYDLMKLLARQAGATLLSLRLTGQLSTARELAAIGKVSTFVVHDLKNLVSGLALVRDNARDYLDDPDFQRDLLRTLDGTVGKMQGLIGKLKNLKEQPILRPAACDLPQLAREVAASLQRDDLLCDLQPAEAEADGTELQRVLLNLVLNAYEASGGCGPVRLATGVEGQPFVRVVDEGRGMSDEFIRTRLFRPFETTRKDGLGIGLYQSRTLVEAMGGRIEVTSEEGRGACFTVWLPAGGM